MSDPSCTLTLTDAPSDDVERTIGDGLAGFNAQQAGRVDARRLAVLIGDPVTGETRGGLLGRTYLGIFFLDLLFVPEDLRGSHIGSSILVMAEQEAVRRGCSAVALFTITFQAPGFYARHGYRELGRVEVDPPGHSRVVMTKRLAAS